MTEEFYQTLKFIAEKFPNINYGLVGSVNLYLQGLKIEPQDIDIITIPEDIIKIDNILHEYRTKEIYFDETDGRNSFRSFYKINGIEIEVLGNVDNLLRDKDQLKQKFNLKFRDLVIPCIPLKNELEVYKKMNRDNKVKIIEEFLQNKK